MHSYLYDGSVFTTFEVPGSVWTDTWAINDSSQIVGSYQDSNGGTYGFLYDKGVFTTLAVPGATSNGAQGINASGQIVGDYHGSNFVRHGYLYDEGVFTTIDVPGASPPATNFYGINASGQIVGSYVVVNGDSFHGFLYEEGVFTTIDVPGAADTDALDINDGGKIVGTFNDNIRSYGFVATPVIADKTPPVITISASPATLSPPNGRLVTVAVSGAITDGANGSGVQASTYQVTDEYGQIQPSGSLTLANGEYAFSVALQASRRGNDRDGRRYTITVSATDQAGNRGDALTLVIVPHG